MTLELFRTLTPRINFLAILILGNVCLCFRWMIGKNNRRPNEFKENLEDIESIIREPERNVDKKALLSQSVKQKDL